MHNSITYWVMAAYRGNEPAVVELAQDASPTDVIMKIFRQLGRRWTKKWNEAAKQLAKFYAKSIADRTDDELKSILKKAGIAVDFKTSKAVRDIMDSIVAENVSLIKSIPQQYLVNVQGVVLRAVQAGRDASTLSIELKKQFGVSQRRASLIARDQNNKATAMIHRARQMELELFEAIWLHSSAGKKPRPTHVANHGKTYDVRTGWFDPAVKKHIWPGTEINCRCVSKTIVAGLT